LENSCGLDNLFSNGWQRIADWEYIESFITKGLAQTATGFIHTPHTSPE